MLVNYPPLLGPGSDPRQAFDLLGLENDVATKDRVHFSSDGFCEYLWIDLWKKKELPSEASRYSQWKGSQWGCGLPFRFRWWSYASNTFRWNPLSKSMMYTRRPRWESFQQTASASRFMKRMHYGGLRWIYHEVCTIRPTHSRISCSKRECFRRTTWTSSFASSRGGARGKPPSRGEMARCVTRNARRSGSRKVSLSSEIRWYKLIQWNTFTFYFGTSFLDHFAKWIQSVQPAAPGMGYQDDEIWMRIGCQNLHHLYHSAKKSTVPWNTKNLWLGTFIITTLPFGVRIFALFAPTRTRASSCFQIQHPNMFSFCELVQVYDRPDSDKGNLHQSWSM